MSAISTGGGMMEVQEIDGSPVSINGDYHELLIYGNNLDLVEDLLPDIATEFKIKHHNFIELKAVHQFPAEIIAQIADIVGVTDVCYLKPVVPVLSRRDLKVPFSSCTEIIALGKAQGLELWELALLYESTRGGISEEQVFENMRSIVRIMQGGIEEGLEGTYYEDRILPVQSLGFRGKNGSQKLTRWGYAEYHSTLHHCHDGG